MIGSFWNLCRACPSMPVDKLHSEYRSTYRWHEYTGPRQEVVRRPPQSSTAAPPVTGERNNIQNTTLVHEEEVQNECKSLKKVTQNGRVVSYIMSPVPKLEPALPRRKKHPELAYRHHEFLASSRDNSLDVSESANNDRARLQKSEERGGSHWRPSRRSKSEGPARSNAIVKDEDERRRESDPDLENTGRETGLLRKAISKLSTEYRLQFAWPHGHISRRDKVDSTPRKSLSMGAIKPTANAMVHRKRIDLENKDASELEPLVNDNPVHEDSKEDKYEYSEGRFTDRGNENKILIENSNPNIIPINATESWYREVVELRKKAGQYKHRGWGTELAPERLSELYNKQTELWDQVSQRSSLSALSLASTTHRSYTKEEKEQENNKRSSPTKPLKNPDNSIRGVKDMIRHHLERTTGGSELDGLILSPTREKLEPTIPRKDEDYRGSQKGSPQKYSPQKGSPQKSAIQKRNSQKVKNALKAVRSQSVGPTDTITEKRSPKRQSRSATVKEKRSSSNSTSATRRPRPSSLNTTASFRSKCSTISLKIEDDRLAKTKSNKSNYANSKQILDTKELQKGGRRAAEQPTAVDKSESIEAPIVTEPDAVDLEPVVKSPPEPTRVKSPEQILMRSPDPVNWTVPLDTGKTFTVTQNIREGDIGTRPHSEIKAWTPPEVPPPAAQSAPPQFSEQTKEQARKPSNNSSNTATNTQELSTASSSEINVIGDVDSATASGISSVAGTTARCLDDPLMEASTAVSTVPQVHQQNPSPYRVLEAPILISPTNERSFASDILEKARHRFDRFWGKSSQYESS
ncbi:uncharacterized protein LOC116165347 isoform X3 [Photinus pyralis]|uniref:uncharacterized protein LOC116165347 isoform X3 n=1 Tax=Photinus pyralis TaxID=7054 RepID=UPI00126706AD|nr:uncharacterized protein LOC116165347 isoform X3 [Photinus pyralis]